MSVKPYNNDKEAMASNGGAYPPDMSVLVKARSGGADYIYSLLLGYDDPPSNIQLDEIAQGQIFSGRQAYNNGLIDKLGTFEDAIWIIGEMAGYAASHNSGTDYRYFINSSLHNFYLVLL